MVQGGNLGQGSCVGNMPCYATKSPIYEIQYQNKTTRHWSHISQDQNLHRMTLKKVDHAFNHQALSYDAAPNYQPCVKLSFFFNKLPEVSYEQFHRHWETVHADLTVAAKDFAVCKIQRYVQFHQTPDMKEKAKSLGLVHMDFDGCSEIWVKTWDDWEKFFNVGGTKTLCLLVADARHRALSIARL